jgi:diguanylate cyclase (GGDEF)-like protein
MSILWRKVLFRAFLTAAASLSATLLIAFTVVPAFGGSMDGMGLIMCIVCPLVTAGPASAMQFYQIERLHQARAQIAQSHAQLDTMHTELRSAHAALAYSAQRDGMTGALNRESFFSALDASASGSGTLLFIDADHFKRINDTFGHAAGDEALKGLARVINAAIREGDYFGRIGGEEFAVFLSGLHQRDEVTAVAERIRKAVAGIQLASSEGQRIPLTVSIGAVSFSARCNVTELWKKADKHLYDAKNQGRNRVVMGGNISAAA